MSRIHLMAWLHCNLAFPPVEKVMSADKLKWEWCEGQVD